MTKIFNFACEFIFSADKAQTSFGNFVISFVSFVLSTAIRSHSHKTLSQIDRFEAKIINQNNAR